MGFDIKATADAAGKAVENLPSPGTIAAQLPTLDQLRPFSGILFVVGMLIAIRAFLKHTRIGERATRGLEETLFTNWRLALLAATGLVLSLASGYTTWDGMRAFTGEAVLSAMVTFGIQGVMLIVAWLIGESFATGMSVRPQQTAQAMAGRATPWLGGLVGTLLFVSLMVLVLQSTGQVDVRGAAHADLGWSKIGDKLLIIVVALLGVALIALYAASDLVMPYLQSSRVIIKNAVLWLMFLSCMATSVFFSFNSLFSVIFPQDQRVRATELRAQNQVAGIVADIGAAISSKHMTEVETLFGTEAWTAYDRQLGELAKVAQSSHVEIEKYFNDKLEERNRAVKQQQERIVTAQSSQAGLASKKVSLTDELSALEASRPGLAAEFAEKKAALDARAKEIDGKRVEAMAEDKGVEGTGKVGKGPIYRQRMDEMGKLQDYYKIGEERVKDAQKRLTGTETRIAAIKRELAGIDGDLAKYKGEAETAEQRIKLTQETLPSDNNARIDPARTLPAFEGARADFRQEPTAPKLAQVQQLCTQIYTAMATATPDTKKKVASIDCDPKQAAEAAALVFALNTGSEVFTKSCSGGDKLNQLQSADALFGFARKCLADSGLPSKETDTLRGKINTIELNRDDKAHPLVATVNAFQDGNRLAYLALFIAISMDMIVFMSGLFGANAVRSPLQDMPSTKPRTAQQLEAIIENALLPDKFENARAIINAMRPMTPHEGFTARIHIADGDPHAHDIARVLNAGASIGAVRHVGGADSHGRAGDRDYEVRSELFEFLSVVAKKAFESDKRNVGMAELEKIVTVALLPDVGDNAQVVLDHMHPITEDRGFTAEIHLAEIDAAHKRVVRNALNAGATLQVVQRVGTDSASYFIHGDFYRALARIRARTIVGGYGQPRLGAPATQDGGAMREAQAQIAPAPALSQIAPPVAGPPPQPAADALSPDEWVAFYRGELLASIGLNDADVSEALISEAVVSAAQDVRHALLSHTHANKLLARLLADYEKLLLGNIKAKYMSLADGAGGDQHRLMALEKARQLVEQSRDLLMLFPESGLIDHLINQLEIAASPDDGQRPGEQSLKDRLGEARAAFRRSHVADERAWREAESALLDHVGQMPNIARFPGKNDNRRMS